MKALTQLFNRKSETLKLFGTVLLLLVAKLELSAQIEDFQVNDTQSNAAVQTMDWKRNVSIL